MLLTDELYNIGKNSKDICTIIDDKYVLVTKSMPVTDDMLNKYIGSIRKARKNGINIASILDYRFIPGTTNYYLNGVVKYTKGVFLEERAPGVCIEPSAIYLETKEDYDSNIILQYLNNLEMCLVEVEKRAIAPQEFYDKLVKDCLDIEKYDLTIDPKPLNFFFDSNVGYTIIDVINGKNGRTNEITPYFSQYIFSIVYGYGRPFICLDFNCFYDMPMDYMKRFEEAYKILDAKIIKALRKHKINEEHIKIALERNLNRYSTLCGVTNLDELESLFIDRYKINNKKK